MTTAIAIVNWNSGACLRPCIESALDDSSVSEIVVVDNASSDGSAEHALAFPNRVHLIRNEVNRGFAGGMNQAFAASRSEFVLAMNPDARAMPGAIAELERLMREHPETGAVGGDVNDRYPPRDLPTWNSLVRQNLGFPARPPASTTDEPRPVGQPAAAALLIRRDAFDSIGGFDETFFPAWYEDVDFCRRLRAARWEIYYAPRARFLHDGGYSAKVLGPKAFASAYYRNQLRYARKHFGPGAVSAIRASIALGMTGRAVLQPRLAGACWQVLCGALGRW
ncbi:MAG TPA: glycosyltransferase family 2 protein [Terriglobia bacterium]|nr:glycosyltransferase family 2 protein [Terriglobia bacterium]